MSHKSESQWEPITCPICGDFVWVMGNKAKPHKCEPDDDNSFERFVDNELPPLNFQQMVKNIVGVK